MKWCNHGGRKYTYDHIRMCINVRFVMFTLLDHTNIRTHSPSLVQYMYMEEHAPLYSKYLDDRLLTTSITYPEFDFKSMYDKGDEYFNGIHLGVVK
jgi:hypothetical protein